MDGKAARGKINLGGGLMWGLPHCCRFSGANHIIQIDGECNSMLQCCKAWMLHIMQPSIKQKSLSAMRINCMYLNNLIQFHYSSIKPCSMAIDAAPIYLAIGMYLSIPRQHCF
jgi:hypothetical protein